MIAIRLHRSLLKAAVLCAAITAIPGVSALAQNGTITISVESDIEPEAAVGVLTTADRTIEILDTHLVKIAPNKILVSFNPGISEAPVGTTITALVRDRDGRMAFGDVKLLSALESLAAIEAIPNCPKEKIALNTLSAQVGLLQSLVDIRTARRGHLRLQVAEILKGRFLEKLQRLEHGFGLDRASEISPELHPLELIDRLARLKTTLDRYKNNPAHAKPADADSTKSTSTDSAGGSK